MALRRIAFLFVFGGLVWATIPLVDDLVPPLQATFVIAPVSLLGGVVGLDREGILSRVTADTLSVAFGIGALVGLVNLLSFLASGALSAVPFGVGLVLVPALGFAVVVAFVGETLLAYDLRAGPTPRALAAFLPLSMLVDLPFNALVTPLVGHGFSLSGLAWVAFGGWLWLVGDGWQFESDDATAPEKARTS